MNYDLLGFNYPKRYEAILYKIYYKFMAQAFEYDTYIIQTNQ